MATRSFTAKCKVATQIIQKYYMNAKISAQTFIVPQTRNMKHSKNTRKTTEDIKGAGTVHAAVWGTKRPFTMY